MPDNLKLHWPDVQEQVAAKIDDLGRIEIDPETVEQDLARLVLGLMEMLRQVMELRAISKLEAGELSASQEEAVGMTLMRAEQAIVEVAAQFGLKPEDLVLDLGPLGKSI